MSPREKRSARDVALDALMQVDKANAWSDEALRRLIAQNGLDSRDAAFATRLCYGVMQNRMLLDYYIGCWCAQKPERLEPVIRSILRIGGYQILFMDRVPHRAAVNEAVEMTRRHGRPKAAGMVNAVLRRFVEHWMDMPDLPKGSTADYLSLRYSHPKWLVLRLLDLIGPDETQEFLRLDNDAVPTCMGDRGQILSCDVHPYKVKLIESGAQRLGLTCIRAAAADARERHAAWEGQADVVMADVPCSGLGIIRKKPDIRYKNPKELAQLPLVQRAILENASGYVRPGGTLVYSTCTVLPEENEDVTGDFLDKHPEFEPVRTAFPLPVGPCPGQVTLWPQRHGTDGFYICRMRRKD